MIKDRLAEVNENIEKAAKISGRTREDITLVAVSKTVENDQIIELNDLGIKDFGENRVQDLEVKMHQIDRDINWHYIGPLQTNKVKFLTGKVKLIQSLDRQRLANTINNLSKREGIITDVLVDINIGEEESKIGYMKDEVEKALEKLSKLENIRIKGLMSMAPYVEEGKEEDNRKYFIEMKEIFDKYKNIKSGNMDFEILSMGMTADYHIAIEEGSNMVRVGSGIFGKRIYN